MGNYTNLKALVQSVIIPDNHANEISGGDVLNSLLAMINSLGAGYQFAGVAISTTNPGTPDYNVFYLAGAGTYPNFGGTTVASGKLGVFSYNGTWKYEIIDAVDLSGYIQKVPNQTGKLARFNADGSLTYALSVGDAGTPIYLNNGRPEATNYVNIHPEGGSLILPFLFNDLYGLLERGGTCTITGTTNDVVKERLFDGSPSYAFLTVGNKSDTVTITIGSLSSFVLTYGNKFYIDFGSANWRAESITLKVYTIPNSGGTETLANTYITTGLALSFWSQRLSISDGYRISKLEIILTDFQSTSARIAEIGIINYNSQGTSTAYMSRFVDELVYRDIRPGGRAYTLGNSSSFWKGVYSEDNYTKSIIAWRKQGEIYTDSAGNTQTSNGGLGFYTRDSEGVWNEALRLLPGSAQVGSSVLPISNSAYTLGDSTHKWSALYAVNVNTSKLTFDAVSVATTADLEVVTVNGVRCLHTRLPFYSDNFISAYGVNSSGGGGGGGTVTGIMMNGQPYNPVSGVIDLGTVITAHQDISGKQDKVSAMGSTTRPVYVSSNGVFSQCSTYAGGTAVTLNGTSRAASTASFYAPTSAGTSGQYLVSVGAGAPSWKSAGSVAANDSGFVTGGAVYTALGSYVTLNTAQTIAGAKTFSVSPNISNGILLLRGKDAIQNNSNSSGVLLIGHGTRDTHAIHLYATAVHYYMSTGDDEANVLTVTNDGISANRDIVPQAGTSHTLGRLNQRWSTLFADTWKPTNSTATGAPQITYATGTNAHWVVTGNLVVTGYITAYGSNPDGSQSMTGNLLPITTGLTIGSADGNKVETVFANNIGNADNRSAIYASTLNVSGAVTMTGAVTVNTVTPVYDASSILTALSKSSGETTSNLYIPELSSTVLTNIKNGMLYRFNVGNYSMFITGCYHFGSFNTGLELYIGRYRFQLTNSSSFYWSITCL